MLYLVRVETASGVGYQNSFHVRDKDHLFKKIWLWLKDTGCMENSQITCISALGEEFTVFKINGSDPSKSPPPLLGNRGYVKV